jgi:hypothetical protein
MPKFTLHRNYVMRTKYGHAINFRKGVATHVPPTCVAEAVSIGAQPADATVDVLGEEADDQIVLEPHERESKIYAAIEDLVARNERGRFYGLGFAGPPQAESAGRF